MFKVPAWGSDIPQANANFSSKINPNQIQSTSAKKTKKRKTKPKTAVPKSKNKISESEPQILPPNDKPKSAIVKTISKQKLEVKRLKSGTKKPKPTLSDLLIQARMKKTGQTQQKPPSDSVPSLLLKPTKSTVKQTKSLQQNTLSFMKLPKKSILKRPKDNTNKKKVNKKKSYDEPNKMLFDRNLKLTYLSKTEDLVPRRKDEAKKEKIKQLLDTTLKATVAADDNKLRDRMMERLKAAQFRYLNEKLYTIPGDQAQKLFEADPKAFQTYHQGYQLQVRKWPINPLDVIVKKIERMPRTYIIADMGCGEATLARKVPNVVHSFDLVAANETVTACDMAHTPLDYGAVDVVVYCLALMGTDLTKYLLEANRVLKTGGHLLIAEVESRFDDINTFTRGVEKLGFKLMNFDKERSVFYFMHFEKTHDTTTKKHKLPQLQLKPCLYKKR